jgi:hypothetical protein
MFDCTQSKPSQARQERYGLMRSAVDKWRRLSCGRLSRAEFTDLRMIKVNTVSDVFCRFFQREQTWSEECRGSRCNSGWL